MKVCVLLPYIVSQKVGGCESSLDNAEHWLTGGQIIKLRFWCISRQVIVYLQWLHKMGNEKHTRNYYARLKQYCKKNCAISYAICYVFMFHKTNWYEHDMKIEMYTLEKDNKIVNLWILAVTFANFIFHLQDILTAILNLPSSRNFCSSLIKVICIGG